MTIRLHLGDCRDVLPTLPDNSVDSIVTDPPYELGFMGKSWDSTGIAYDVNVWRECLRILKPGGHLLAFGGSRTYHRLACVVEDAGFEIRDQIMWIYGSGFPKSLAVDKAIDKAAGAERRVVGIAGRSGANRNCMSGDFTGGEYMATAPATPDAARWQGFGTALKPAHEPIVLARKPLAERTVAANVLTWGCGALNVDGCRVGTEQTVTIRNGDSGGNGAFGRDERVFKRVNPPGRFPANLVHDGSDEVVGLFPTTGPSAKGTQKYKRAETTGWLERGGSFTPGREWEAEGYGNSGSAARFFYCAKASKRDRDEGLEDESNGHPCVKPTALMRYLCRLVTPPGGVVLDPFMGSGSTGKAAVLEGFGFIGIEKEAEYMAIAERRIEYAQEKAIEMQPVLL